MFGNTPFAATPFAAAGGPTAVIAYTAALTETAVAAESSDALLDFAVSIHETAVADDVSSTSSLLSVSTAESGAAIDLSSESSAFFAIYVEPDSVYELISAMAAFFAGSTDAYPLSDAAGGIIDHPSVIAESGAAVDILNGLQPIPPRSINELVPLTDEAHTPPFVPGIALALEYLDGEDMDTVSIMQASQSKDELLMSSDSDSAVINVGYSGDVIDGLALADMSTGTVFLFYNAATADTATITDATDGLAGYTASITELEDYFFIDTSDAGFAAASSVSDTLALTDAQTKAQNTVVVRLEALAAADTVSVATILRTATIVETLSLVDHESASFNAGAKSVQDALNAIDKPTTGKAVAVSVAEILSLIDARAQAPGLLRSVHEIDTLADLINVPTATLHAALIEALHAIDTSKRSFLVFRVQAEAASAADVSNGAKLAHLSSSIAELDSIMDLSIPLRPYVATRTEVLRATDVERTLDVSGFILGNPERVSIAYRRRVWVLSSTRQE